MNTRHSVAIRVYVVALVLVFVGALALFHSFHGSVESRVPFDREKWLSVRHLEDLNDPGCFRGGMALDVLKSGVLTGATAPRVEATLGPPTTRTASAWRYALGQCTGLGWHHSELLVAFTPQQLVQNAEIRRTEAHAP